MSDEIVFVDDEKHILEIFREIFSGEDFKTSYFVNSVEAQKYILENGKNIIGVIADLKMPELDGFSLIKSYGEEFPKIENYIVTAYWKEMPSNLENFNIKEVIRKPVNLIEMKAMLMSIYKEKPSS